jgi:phosphoribosylanthranilate isomerase
MRRTSSRSISRDSGAPYRLTLTGADERTSVRNLRALINMHPLVEIGILYSANPDGRPRYPSPQWIERTAAALPQRCSIHICGGVARAQLLAGELNSLIQHADRVQVNGCFPVAEAILLTRCVKTLITQHTLANVSLVASPAHNHQILVDSSGGTGERPPTWERPVTEKCVGFAGGLGPDNIALELPRIAQVATGKWWIDMETNLRTADWFDTTKAVAVISAVYPGTSWEPAFHGD